MIKDKIQYGPEPKKPNKSQDIYWIEPEMLAKTSAHLQAEAQLSGSFSEACRRTVPLLSKSYNIEGLDLVPSNGPLIVIKNHPCHFDFTFLGDIFELRPDIRWFVKAASHSNDLPETNVLTIRKKGPHGDIGDIRRLHQHLVDGGSLMVTPWGALDHQAEDYSTQERSIQNIIRFAKLSNATVLPVHMNGLRGKSTTLPLQRVDVRISSPIRPNPNGIDAVKIAAAVSALYPKTTA